MLNRVFQAQSSPNLDPVEVVVKEIQARKIPIGKERAVWVAATAGIAILGTSLMAFGLWQANQRTATEERNLLLLNQLKTATSQTAREVAGKKLPIHLDESLPPPPPQQEPWMEELAQLPANGASNMPLIQVPVGKSLNSKTAQVTENSTPVLIGVIQGPSGSGSAIFQIQGTIATAAVGERIGASGWTLRRTTGEGAAIESNGVQRNLSVSASP
ncbi:hypothetical protein [Cyanobium sp. WAJ14-Wanaka]|uniref:hypothetical protein n=1 Tax=Cyanobium sp. WAJ14-Wanaka TaxID=2823725 RepID=UPI0020CF4758|nr:hypothetical protein [Cyanobium sp. WAJ14-Wanaka]MCP9775453.1 hypothetical protein [Cyanobium sp. WAJ14-Wanaka]